MSEIIGVVGSGSMGSGIAQVAASKGHKVLLYDQNAKALEGAISKISSILHRLVEKGRITENECSGTIERINAVSQLESFKECDFVIEAIIEDLEVKKSLFRKLENIVGNETILATNTSSLSVAAIGSSCEKAERVLGVHFFNPAPLMPLVEIVPGILTDDAVLNSTRKLIDSWGKVTVVAKDTPGFIVNRVARPFYGEALRMLEEGITDAATIDWAMKELGGFRMGPFELMDYIGNDINYTVTETVFQSFYFDPRYKPSFTQKRMSEAGLLGRKSGRGYYDYREGVENPEPSKDVDLGNEIFERILVMLINEAVDALYLNIASRDDLETAMTKGVNYPKGLLKWVDEFGVDKCFQKLRVLQENYGEDRYRPSFLLKKMAEEGKTFYS